MNDLKFALRQLLKNPGFATVAVVLLALGIGLNLTVFTLLNAVLLRPMPGVHEADRLVMLGRTQNGQGFDASSYPEYCDYRDQNEVFSGLAACDSSPFNLASDGQTERIRGQVVSANFFSVIGVKMAAGRAFIPQEEGGLGRGAAAVVSHSLWQRRWAGDPRIVGMNIRLNNQSVTIIGITEQGFNGTFLPGGVDVWVPLSFEFQRAQGGTFLTNRSGSWLRMIGRLKPEASIVQADAQIATIGERLRQTYPEENQTRGHRVADYHSFGNPNGRRDATIFLSVLTAFTALVLLVVSANVANLLLARASVRRREVAIRLAVGASPRRLIRQMLTEGCLLALMGGAAASALSFWSTDLLVRFLPTENGAPAAWNLAPDLRVLAYIGAVVLLSTFAFALLPALQSLRLGLLPALRSGEASIASRSSRLRASLTVAQVALCLVLLAGAGVLLRSLHLLRAIDPRMRVDNLLLLSVDPELNGYDPEEAMQFYDRTMERLRAVPGVEVLTVGRVIPFSGGGVGLGRIHAGDVAQADAFSSDCNVIGPDYFRTTGITLLRGREFLTTDRSGAPSVVIVNETLARRLWPAQEALGQLLYLESRTNQPMEVIGIARDGRYRHATERPRTFYYIPQKQAGTAGLKQTLHVRTGSAPAAITPLLRQAVREIDPNLPVFDIRTMRTVLDESFFPQRLGTTLVTLASALALVMATVGLYAVMAHHVSQRTREIGVRIALGATRRWILGATIRSGLTLAGIGIAIGIALALAGTRALSNLLYGVTPTDALTFITVSFVLVMTSVVATYLPARRATRIDPMVALRYE